MVDVPRRQATFDRAVVRAGITTGDVTLHTLRHTALRGMIASGYDDYTVMEISGHSSTRMLARYTHPREERKVAVLDLPAVVTNWSQTESGDQSTAEEIAELLKKKWWTAGGSNSRPLRCERSALPAELAARFGQECEVPARTHRRVAVARDEFEV